MIELKRIENINDTVLSTLIELYESSFPDAERRPIRQLKHLIENNKDMFFNSIIKDNAVVGLMVYWKFNEFFFLEHFAIFSNMRNNNIGRGVLDYITNNLKGIRILEVEEDNTDIAKRRIEYYRRNGYQIVDNTYIQPSFDNIKPSIPLWIMCNEPLQTDIKDKYISIIKQKVYADNTKL